LRKCEALCEQTNRKARLFGDEKVARDMLKTRDPKAHKALGRKVRGFDEGVWNKSESLWFSIGRPMVHLKVDCSMMENL
jgi:predicted NAD-dependent protein-ADP-ribosyltransferase YbiA (DUF1768 family)